MFKIGEFSRFSRVSVKMLRHYDQIGLLEPAHIDPFTHYRYYSADQLPRLHRIIALKDLGFTLEQIATLIDGDLSAEQIRGMLKRRRAEIARRLRDEEARLARVEARLADIERTEQPPQYDVVLRAVMDEMVATIRQKIGENDKTVTDLFEELEAWVARHQARAPRPPLMLYHDTEYQDGAQDVEVAVPVRAPLPGDKRISVRELPGHDCMACLVHTGRYDSLPGAFSALLRWIERHDHVIVGPVREVFLRFGASQRDYVLPDVYLADAAAEYVTEVQIPVSKACPDNDRQFG